MTRRPRPLADVLPALRGKLAPATLLADVQTRWPAAAGAEIARHATPVSERGGVVTVACDSAVWAAELQLMAPRLLAALNAGRPGDGRGVVELRFAAGVRDGY